MQRETFIRPAAKLVILDPDDRVLLLRYPSSNGNSEPFWTVPGGGVHPGETHEQAAARELGEETGIVAEIGPLLWSRTNRFPSSGSICQQEKQHFLVRVAESVVIEAPGPDPDEPMTEARWWAVDELKDAEEAVFPGRLPELLRTLIADGPATVPPDAGI